MIHELERQRYAAIEPIVSSIDENPEAVAVIRGTNPGRIFVDHVDDPRGALIWSMGIEGFYLVGNPKISTLAWDLDEFIRTVLTPEMQELKYDWFEVSADRAAWNQAVEKLFSGRSVSASHQSIYRLDLNSYVPSSQSYEKLRHVRQLDAGLLVDPNVRNLGFIHSKLDRFWESHKNFHTHGIGFAVLHEHEIASLCFSAFVSGDKHVIDIETTLSYRRKGYARIAALSYLNECKARLFRSHWDCMSDNIASRRLAEGLGFQLEREYTLYSLRLENGID